MQLVELLSCLGGWILSTKNFDIQKEKLADNYFKCSAWFIRQSLKKNVTKFQKSGGFLKKSFTLRKLRKFALFYRRILTHIFYATWSLENPLRIRTSMITT